MKRIKLSKWFVGIFAVIFCSCAGFAQTVHINEVMSSNVSTIQDEDGTFSDWVEIYNPGVVAINLLDWGLTDSASNPYKWRFGDVSIQPGEFMMVWASSKNRPAVTNANAIHTSWAISSGGEDVVLTRPDGSTASSFGASIIGIDRSLGRKPDGTGPMHFFDVATPGAANTTVGIPTDLPLPVFSVNSGIYTNDQIVEITSDVPGAVIRYTLDGSEPTTNSPIYTGALTVTVRSATANLSLIPTNDNNDPGPPYFEGWQPPVGDVFRFRTVRAKNFLAGSSPSKAATRSYVITPAGTSRYTLPIMSINTDDANFFDPNIGIYVKGNNNNYFQDGSEWERPGSLEMIETNGVVAFQNNVGIRLHGTTTVSRPRKGLRIYMRDPATLNYQVFPDKDTYNFNSFIMRAGGNDWGNTIFRDAFAQSLVDHMKVDRQHARPVLVFLNGEYWGIHHIRDRFDEGYIQNHYGLGESEFVQMEADLAVSQRLVYDRGNESLVPEFFDLMQYLNVERVVATSNYAHVKTRMDVDNYIDYLSSEIYFGNTDWPGNNIKLWRSASTNTAPNAPYGHDARWRWMIYDTDFGFGADFFYVPGHGDFANYNSIAHASAENGAHFSNQTNATLMFRRLLENTEFRATFVSRFSDHLNSAFKTDRVLNQLNTLQAKLAPEMAEHTRRWRQPTNWSNDVQRVRNYASLRNDAVWGHLKSFFNLGDRRNVTVDVSDALEGYVQVNSIEVTPDLPGVSESVYPWSGSYFTNTIVTLTAKAKPGYRFVKWVNSVAGNEMTTNETFSFFHNAASSYTALFELDQSGLVPQPFNLGTGNFSFTEWAATEPAGTYPANMIFEQVASADPSLNVDMDSYWILAYNIGSRSRINGQGTNGISFINTGDKVALPGSGFIGSAIAALSTIGRSNVQVSFTSGTIIPNFRTYALRLQYRVGATGPFTDVLENGLPVEYVRNASAGHTQAFGPVALPEAVNNKSYVQLRWKYHYVETGVTGARAQIRLDDITVTSDKAPNAPVVKVSANSGFDGSGGTAWLNGSLSKDADGQIVSYQWSQVSGPSVTISDATQAIAQVVIPAQSSSASYQFQLVVTDDDGLSSTGVVTVSQTINLTKLYNQVYFRGTPNAWGTSLMSLVSNNVWETQSTFGSAANERFKFDINGDWTLNFGENNSDGIADQSGQDIAITQGAGLYTIRFNDQTKRYWINKVVPNVPPSASGGGNRTVKTSGETITFNGGASTDSDGFITSFTWTQVSGPAAIIQYAGSAFPVVTIPPGTNGTKYEFSLVVTDDDGASATGAVNVTQQNVVPMANAGTNQTVLLAGGNVVLNGSGSSDADGTIASYSWSQVSGPSADITNENTAVATVSIPAQATAATYVFSLVVTDDDGASATGTVTVSQNNPLLLKTYNQVYFRGTPNSWGTTIMSLVSNYTWEITANFGTAVDERFKFDVNGNWSLNFGDNNNDGIADQSGGNIAITQGAGTYIISFNDQTKRYTVTKVVVNVPPTANPGVHQLKPLAGGSVTLNGSGSTDSDGTIVSYIWSQIEGPSAIISNAGAAVTSVAIPAQVGGTNLYRFSLVVTDNSGASATGTVMVLQQNGTPNAHAGTNQTVLLAGGEIMLNGTASSDVDGTIVSYSWFQYSGPAVVISNDTSAIASVIIPSQTSPTSYVFGLVVTDNDGGISWLGGINAYVTIAQSNPVLLKSYPQMYFRGTPNGWGTTSMALVSNYVWEIQAIFGSATNERFKFDVNADWTVRFGDDNKDGICELSGADIPLTQGAGTYIIRFNDQTKRYWVIKQIVNQPPVVNAGTNQTLALAGGGITLNGSATFDAMGSVTSYVWSQVSGPSVILSNANAAIATSFIPARTSLTVYVFALVATDNEGLSATGTVTITQQNASLLKSYPQVYFRGTANGWGTTVMTLVSNYVWEIEATFGPGATERFKFDINGNWSLNFGDNNADGLAEQSGGNIMITQGSGTYRIRFNDQTKRYWVYKNGAGFASSYSSMTMAGTFNSWNPTANNMVLVDNNTWQYDVVLFSAINFKFVANGAWASGNWGEANQPGTSVPLNGVAESSAGNIVISTALAGAYRITFNEITRAYSMQAIPAVASFGAASATFTTPWEKLYQINLLDAAQREQDPDAEGLKNLTEYYQDIHPFNADTDGDGISDRDELLSGTDPRLSDNYLDVAFAQNSSGNFEINWTGAADRSYVVESVQSLNGSWTTVNGYSSISGVSGTMTANVTDAINAGAIAFRVKVINVMYLPE